MAQTIIEINGVKYDAATGEVVSAPQQTATRPSNIDGFINRQASSPKPDNVAHATNNTPHSSTPSTKPVRHISDIKVVGHHRVTKSKTLMRSVVKKPGQPKQNLHPVMPKTPITPSQSYKQTMMSEHRLKMALQTPRTTTVKKFNLAPQARLEPKIANVPMASSPATPSQSAPPLDIQRNQPKPAGAESFIAAQLARQSEEEPIMPKKKGLKGRFKSKKRGQKILSASAATLSVLLIAGFLAYQNMASISLLMANNKSGISAHIPKGVPSNFAILNTINASKGQVSLSFKSRTDDRKFTITQQQTDMSAAELGEVLASSDHPALQSFDSNGIKLFITSAGNADWIDGNMRINISGDSGLTTEQLATIAKSL
ncbi:hypothetical protein KC930_02390 [Candidatus Saccharibacteria bacterium]|nr:hypothetical protein [Candidatus Saccharibacteria bacterium]